MKKIILSILLLSAVLTFTACDNRDESGVTDANNTDLSKNETDSTRGDNTGDSANMQTSTPADQESIDFAMKAASGGMMEVQAGQLAQQNAKSQRVKDFGGMMVNDHGKANEELKTIAASKNITLPAALMPEHQKHIDMMSKMKGSAFDKHYMGMMVNDHNKDVSDFKKASESLKDEAMKAFAGKTLPTLQMHLDSAKAINKKM